MGRLRDAFSGGGKIGDTGRKAEKRTARRMGGKPTPASGAMPGAKGDFSLADFLVENKSTVNSSFTLTLAMLAKIDVEAHGRRKAPALALQFTDGIGQPIRGGAWVVIPEWKFQEMLDA